MLLTADVGATKTALAAMSDPAEARSPVANATYPTTDWDDLVSLVRSFLQENELEVDRAAFGVPGPVVAGHARLTNLPWEVSAERLRRELGLAAVTVVNDLQGIAQAVPELREDEVETVREGRAVEHGTIGVVAPGTGLGEAFLTWDGRRYRAYPSEGGHTDFAPANELQRELLRHVSERLSHVSYERVCSGSAVPRLYEFLRDTGRAEEPYWLAERLREAEDEMSRLRDDRFLDAVVHKGRLSESELMTRLAVRVVTGEQLAHVGLAQVAAGLGNG